jgi:hypothetical protein
MLWQDTNVLEDLAVFNFRVLSLKMEAEDIDLYFYSRENLKSLTLYG